jgi:hypothetical protein
MKRSDIEAQATRQPFREFSIETGGGSWIQVSHPSRILLPTERPYLAIAFGPVDGGTHIIEIDQIVALETK